MCLQVLKFAPTFACLDALKPAVDRVSVADNPTTFVPITTGSTATESPGFLEHAALGAYHRINGR